MQFDVINPATEAVIASVELVDAAATDEVVRRSVRAFETWSRVPASDRARMLRRFADAVATDAEQLALLETENCGHPVANSRFTVNKVVDVMEYYAAAPERLIGQQIPVDGGVDITFHEPIGVVGVIAPWNFPLMIAVWGMMPALAAGNSVILKPSELTPLTTIRIAELAAEAGLPIDLVQVVTGAGSVVGQALLDHPDVAKIVFTGSTKVGRIVGERVARRMGRSLLELGGNNAIIVDESADLKLAIPAIVFGAVGTCGQRCTTTRRLIVHESIYDNVLAKLITAYGQVEGKIGDPTNPANLVGPLNSSDAVDAFLDSIAKAKAAGGNVEIGGTAIEGKGFFVKPAIVTGLGNDAEVVQHETFAPILYVMKYSDIDQAIDMQNAVPQGLSSAIFTTDLKRAEAFLAATGSDCGIANVNIGTSGAEIGGAFGGEKETGGGRESGSDAWKAYMRRQTNTINYSDALPLAQGIKFDF